MWSCTVSRHNDWLKSRDNVIDSTMHGGMFVNTESLRGSKAIVLPTLLTLGDISSAFNITPRDDIIDTKVANCIYTIKIT